jgi:hypothetical protein
MTIELTIEHIYSNCYPKEQADDSNYFKLKFNTKEEASEYVNNLYEKTKEYSDRKPHNTNWGFDRKPDILDTKWGWILHTYEFIPKEKQAKKEDIIKLLRDPNDYDNIPKRDIEMYSISVWLNEQKK